MSLIYTFIKISKSYAEGIIAKITGKFASINNVNNKNYFFVY